MIGNLCAKNQIGQRAQSMQIIPFQPVDPDLFSVQSFQLFVMLPLVFIRFDNEQRLCLFYHFISGTAIICPQTGKTIFLNVLIGFKQHKVKKYNLAAVSS
jgi:hypothetical protein